MLIILQLNQLKKKTKIKNIFCYLVLLLCLQINVVALNYFDSFQITDLNDKSTLVDFADYYNSYIFITTSKKIYVGINPQYKSTINAEINEFTFGVSYDENYILLACLDDSLLAKVNINTGETISLLPYEKINGNLKLPKYPCSLSYYDNFAYIAFSFGYDIEDPFGYIYKEDEEEEQKIEFEEYKEEYEYEEMGEEGEFIEGEEFLEKEEKIEEMENEEKKEMEKKIEFKEEQQLEEKEEIIEEMENEEKEEEEFRKDEIQNNKTKEVNISKILRNLNEEKVNYIKNYAIKIKLNNTNNGPIIDEDYKILFHHFDYELNISNIKYTKNYRHISCEVITSIGENDPRLICGYIIYHGYIYLPFKILFVVFNKNFNGFEKIDEFSNTLPGNFDFKLQRINSTFIRYSLTLRSYLLYLEHTDNTYFIRNIFSDTTNKICSFNSYQNLFFSNNEHIFSFNLTCSKCSDYYLHIYKNVGLNYFRYYTSENIKKIMGYFNVIEDKYLIIYQTDKTIKYFKLENLTLLFNLNSTIKTINRNSSSPDLILNIRELISDEYLYDEMIILSRGLYISQYKVDYSFNSSLYNFNQTNQILTIYKSENNWYYFKFEFQKKLEINNIIYNLEFIPENCIYKIKTCDFKCGSCFTEYKEDNKCDEGSCRNSFTVLKDSNDTNCYPIDQNFFNYIYNSTTNYYEKCYKTCRFCSLMGNFSTINSQNCKNCSDGYLISYEYYGNCYKIDNLINNKIKKIINKIDDENFTIVNSCLETNKIYTIEETGECVSKCPQNYIYYYYNVNNSINFTTIGEEPLTQKYTMYSKSIPKYLFGNLCLTSCPYNTNINNNKCECIYSWHQNITTKEIICYNKINYCIYDNYYKYYLNDKKECIHEKCPNNYYMFYFQCYLNNCPNNTISSLNNKYICESKYNYCYIDENYQNHCQDNKFNTHKYQYNYTKLYFKSCNESLFLYNIKTYLYNNICLPICPEQTYLKNNNCICKYYIYYLDENKEYYNCLLKNEICEDKNLFPVIELNECLNTLNDCIKKGYKIFNKQCYLNCPNNTKLLNDGYNCFCKYHYFTNSNNLLNCFDSNITCEEKGFFVNNLDNGHCLNSTDDCIKEGYKIFNKKCYLNCPNNTELKNDNYTCFCSYHYFVDSNNMFICFDSDKKCEDKGYLITNLDNKECLNSINDCINKNYSIFNNQCYINCPINTKLNIENNLCICSYYYIENNNKYICFDKDITCKDKGYSIINIENKECLNSINDCINKNYKIFNNECYINCPINTHLINSNFCFCSFNYFNNTDNNSICFNQNQNCKSQGHPITNIDNKQCLDSLNDCILNNYFIFNNNCYLECPKSTIINETNKNYCICKYSYEINEITNEIKCENFPDEYYKNPEECLAIYKGKCYKKCPEGTCFLSTNDIINCVDIKSDIKIINGICFEEYKEIIDIVKNMSENIEIIKTNCGANISIYYADNKIEELIKKNPYSTFIDLGECGDLLKKYYELPLETELRLVVIDCPNKNNITSISDFSYEIYLGNGTQLKNLSICQKIKTSSFINDPDKVKLKTAQSFFNQGYDIYNILDSFYINYCTSAVNSEGYDITLKDRMKDIYIHNISLCITGCEYNKVDFNKQRFICECNTEIGENYEIKLFNNNTEEEISYLDYFLSLINYKIINCSKLLSIFSSYDYNMGLLFGVVISIICFIDIFIFLIYGLRKIKIIFLENFPNRYKLQELAIEQEKNRLKNLKIEKEEEKKSIENNFKQLNKSNFYKRKKYKSMTKISIIKSDIKNNSNPPKIINITNKKIEYNEDNKVINNFIRKKSKKKLTQINYSEKFKNSAEDLQSLNSEEKRKDNKKMNLKQYLKGQHINNNNKLNGNNKISMNEIPLKENNKIENNNFKRSSSKLCIYKNKEDIPPQYQNLIEIPSHKNQSSTKMKSFNVIRNIDNYEINNDLKNTKIDRELNLINHRKSIIEIKEELIINKDFSNLILIDDDNVNENELNDVPFSQAIRLDKRNFLKIFLSFFTKEVELLKIILYFHPFSHFSLLTSVYFTELLLDLALNCFLYSDDIVSEKYHNNGELKYFTTLYLSFLANIFSSMIVFVVEKLTVYEEILESIIKEVKIKDVYLLNMHRLLKYVKIRIGLFYIIQTIMNFSETYYLIIFCTIYRNSQSNVMVNYIVGLLESLAISFGISFINAFLRLLSLRKKSNNLYNVSKFIADKF